MWAVMHGCVYSRSCLTSDVRGWLSKPFGKVFLIVWLSIVSLVEHSNMSLLSEWRYQDDGAIVPMCLANSGSDI